MRNFIKMIALAIAVLPAFSHAQTNEEYKNIFQQMDQHGIFNRLELAANIGTTGFGLEVASPVTKWTKLRVGFDYMPKFAIPMTFGLDSYVDGQVSDKFTRIQDIMYQISGMEIDKEIEMRSKPTMTTLRVMVDVYPFRNRHWHLTAGFFYGGNSVGTSLNKMEEMPSLLALKMYNRLYDEVTSDDFIDNVLDKPIINDIYLDPEIAMVLQEKMLSFGELGIHVGDYKDGKQYIMYPSSNGTVSAKAKVWRFRPYLGFGYGGFLDNGKKWHASFDAGVQYWGGCPKVTTHDGTVLNDLINLRGKVNSYMNLMKSLVVYPTIDFRLAYCF